MHRVASRFLHHLLAGAVLFLCLTLLLSACDIGNKGVQTPQKPSATSEMDSFLQAEVKAEQFSGSVLVARKGTILLNKGYGLANDNPALANTPTTMFGLGSVTKEFTAMAILILQERGKLHIADRICIYLSPCSQAWQPITIYRLLTHSSGIPNHFQPNELTLMQLEQEPLDFKPGSQFSYSNSGYVVLAMIIEKVSGQAYGTFLQQNIFTPLRMMHTGYNYIQSHLPGIAAGHSTWGVKADYTGISLEFGADGLYSTTEDLYRWDQALFTHTQTLVSNQALNEMFTNTVSLCPSLQAPNCSSVPAVYQQYLNIPTDAPPLALGYGYGWYIATVEGSKNPIIYHPGSTWGFNAYNTFYSQEDITIIVLCNVQIGRGVEGIAKTLYQFATAKA